MPQSIARPAFQWRPFIAFEDTNLVGNVYFAKFVSWQGRCREAFLAEHAPDVLTLLSGDLKIVTLNVSCEYFDELRAFDTVCLEMRLVGIRGNRIELSFDYYVDRLGGPVLAARGLQQIACMIEGNLGQLTPGEIPPLLKQALYTFDQ